MSIKNLINQAQGAVVEKQVSAFALAIGVEREKISNVQFVDELEVRCDLYGHTYRVVLNEDSEVLCYKPE